ncbi:MAG: hypothetical protein HYZ75_03095 [Elusimicrobia bacterium]|nr:hypothetical protein [Elusimicrobiota bacterium]
MTIELDFREFLKALIGRDVRFVLVGAFAVIHQGFVRTTGDMDVWVYPDPENAERVVAALGDFGFSSLGVSAEDILSGDVIQLGRPPVRIDILTSLSGVSTAEIWQSRERGKLDGRAQSRRRVQRGGRSDRCPYHAAEREPSCGDSNL